MRKLWSSLRGQPREVWILFATSLINRAGTMALPFLVLYLTRQLEFTPARAGMMLAIYGAGSLVAAPLSGWLCDRIGSTRILVASLLLTGVALLIYPLAHGLAPVIAMTLAWSLSNELYRPAALAAVSEVVTPEKRRAAFALHRLAINLGMSVGPLVGGLLALASMQWIFLVDGVTSLLAGAFLWWSMAKWRSSAAGSRVPHAHEDRPPVRTALSDRRYVAFLVALIPVAIVFFQHESAMALYLVRDLHLKESTYGLMFTINTLLIVLVEVPLNAAMSRWPHARTLILGSLLVGAGFGALALVRTIPGVALTVVIWTFGEMILLPGMSSYVADIAPDARRGEYMGLYTMAFGAAFAIGPWAGTLLLDQAGSNILWASMFVFGAFSALLFSRVVVEPPALRAAAGTPA
ncbi:MAG: MFS transporter [Thermoanaerobaculia bacterium]